MELAEKVVKVRTSVGLEDTVNFTAKLDGVMFDSLINGIYSNKMGAGIREYSTNARDGHARRGILDKPFEVGLPTNAKPIFEVRDFGSSLSHKDVFEVYTVLGESTKRGTNDETGCLGLGSKSAFAYTNSFTVTCWLNDEKRDYACYIGEEGKPVASLISTIKSKEPQGVRVSYAVDINDVNAFNTEASRQLRGFSPQPKIIRKNEYYSELSPENIMLKGEDWAIYKSDKQASNSYYSNVGHGKPMAIQGSVAYPIDLSNSSLMQAINRVEAKKAQIIKAMLSKTDVLIKFPIGQLRMTTSREDLAYDPETCSNIVNRAEEVVDAVQAEVDKQYAGCKTMREARILYSKTTEGQAGSIDRILGITDRKWQGKNIDSGMRIECFEDDKQVGACTESHYSYMDDAKMENPITGLFRIEQEYVFRNKFGEVKSQFKWKEASNQNAQKHISLKAHQVGKLKVLVDIEAKYDGVFNFNSLFRRYWKEELDSDDDHFLWLKVNSVKDAEAFLEQIFHDEPDNVTYLHDMIELKMPKKGVTATGATVSATEKKLRTIHGSRWAYTSDQTSYETIEFLTTTEKLPVLFFKNSNFYWSEEDMKAENESYSYQDIVPIIQTWKSGVRLYVINSNSLKFYKENKHYFRDARKYLVSEFKKDNQNWEAEWISSNTSEDTADDTWWGRKLYLAGNKFNIRLKDYDHILKKNEDKYSDRKYNYRGNNGNALPRYAENEHWMKTELAAAEVKLATQKQNTVKNFSNLMNKDPVLKYLISEVEEYRNDDDHIAAIRHYVDANYS